jgi:hypothetical protein
MLLKSVRLHKYQVRHLLSDAKKNTFLGLCIHHQLDAGADLDNLVEQVREAAGDNPASVRRVIGDQAYDELILK